MAATLVGPSSVLALEPGNDNLDTAQLFDGGAALCIDGTTVGATKEPEEGIDGGTHTVWYHLDMTNAVEDFPGSGTKAFTFRIHLGTMLTSYLQLYEESPAGSTGYASLSSITGNGTYYGYASYLSLTLDLTHDYYLQISNGDDAIAGDAGTFKLDVNGGCAAPANDAWANRVDLGSSATGTRSNDTNRGATLEAGELHNNNVCTDWVGCTPYSDLGGTSIWYSWTAPDLNGDGSVFTETICVNDPATYDTIVFGIYTGDPVNGLNETAFIRDYNAWGYPCQQFDADPGTTYSIGIGGDYGATFDDLNLEWGTDLIGPEATIELPSGQPNPDKDAFDVLVTFPEPVLGFDANDILFFVPSGYDVVPTVDSITGSNPYTVHVTWTGTSGYIYTQVRPGAVTDVDGHPNRYYATVSIGVDGVAPTNVQASATVKGGKVTVAMSAQDTGDLTFTCTFDGTRTYDCHSGSVFNLPSGTHTLVVTATDLAQNSGVSSAVNFTIKSGRYKVWPV